MIKTVNFIDGLESHISNKTIDITNPANGEKIGDVCISDKNDFEKCMSSSKKAFSTWSQQTPLKRSRILSNYKNILEKNSDKLAEMICLEHGKTFEDAIGSITRGIEVVEFATGIPHLLKGEFSENVGTNIDSWSVRQPLGISAGITPFNFPAMVPMWMYPVAIACGNCFILKPSEKTPTASNYLAKLFIEAGLPEGVLNVLHGDKDVVDLILESKDIDSVSFVGSTNVAKYIYMKSASNYKRVQALGGAKNHLVVMPDANLDQAVDGIIGAAYGSAGERCMAVSAVLAVGETGNLLVPKLQEKINKLKIGPWNDPDSDMGPLISKDHYNKVVSYIEKGISEKGTIIEDGRNFKLQGYENGNFLGPTLFDNVTKEMSIYKEEIFGPVLSLLRTKDYEECVSLINNHEYGNGTSIYTSNGSVARDFTSSIKIGMVGVNVPIPVPMAFHSFGGWKSSLFGDHSMHGMEGVRFYTKLKTVTSRWVEPDISMPEFKMPTN